MRQHLTICSILLTVVGCTNPFARNSKTLEVSANNWLELTIPEFVDARTFQRAVKADDTVYIWGGFSTASPTMPPVIGTGLIFTHKDQLWQQLPHKDAPSARMGHTMVASDNQLIVWGGSDARHRVLADGSIFTIDKNAWTPLPHTESITARRHHTAVVINDEMFVWGGTANATRGPRHLSDGGILNLKTKTWKQVSSPAGKTLDGRIAHVSVAADDEVLIWGGHANGGRTNTGWRYHMRSHSWRAMSQKNAPAPRAGACGLWANGKLWIFGGLEDGGVVTKLYAYDPHTDTWQDFADAPGMSGRSNHACAASDNELFVVAGRGAKNHYLADAYAFDLSSNQWRRLPDITPPRMLHSLIAIDGRLFIWGGMGRFGNGEQSQLNHGALLRVLF